MTVGMIVKMKDSDEKAIIAADTVEIFDNGVRVGSAPVSNGRWSLPVNNLKVGDHRFIARNNGIESNGWVVTVQSAVDTENFDDCPAGWYEVITRPYYRGVSTVYAHVLTGRHLGVFNVQEASGLSEMKGALQSQLMKDGEWRYNYVRWEQTFNREYSKITFDGVSWGGSPNAYSAGAGITIEARASNGSVIQRVSVPLMHYGFRSEELSAPGGAKIKSLVFLVTAGTSHTQIINSEIRYWFDNMFFYV